MNAHESYAASAPLPVSSLGHGSLLRRLRLPALIGASFDFVLALETREHLALPTFAKGRMRTAPNKATPKRETPTAEVLRSVGGGRSK
jgi:hypothetical protein